jgi:hypothetical protein
MENEGFDVPLVGNIFILTYGAAGLMKKEPDSGVSRADELLRNWSGARSAG